MQFEAWKNIQKALEFYVKLGYLYVDMPWYTSKEAVLATIPQNLIPTVTQDKYYLVGSSEQSFVDEMMKDHLAPGTYCSCTPCFRDETIDELHKKYFMKVELIKYSRIDLREEQKNSPVPAGGWQMIAHAKEFFESLAGPSHPINGASTKEGTDLELGGIEIGSYGIRSMSFTHQPNIIHEWAYGTGLAEPRFSLALAKTML